MNFLFPGFLFALAALAIPIIIHLFSFRRFKTVYFSNVRFLREVKEETASRSRLKHLLALIARCLALAFLIFAFAQPFIPREETQVITGSRAVSIYVDNSFSMDAIGDEVSLLEKAKEKAGEIASAFGPEDKYQLITNDFRGKHQRLVNREVFNSYLQEVEVSPAVRNLQQVKERQMQALEHIDNKVIYQVSDFQENIVNLNPDTTVSTFLVPLKSVSQKNLSIDSVWLSAPVQILNERHQLFVSITNYGEENIQNSSINLEFNGQMKALESFSVAAGETMVDTINFTTAQAGWHRAEVRINDYPITFDDSYYFTFFVPENLKVLVINQGETDRYFRGLSGQSIIELTNQPISQVNYSSFGRYDLIALNQLQDISSGLAEELKTYISAGGNVLLFPAGDATISSYNTFLNSVNAGNFQPVVSKEQPVTDIELAQGLFREVFDELPDNLLLPTVKQYYPIRSAARTSEEVVLRMQDGQSFLSKFSFDRGNVFLSAVPPDLTFSDLPKHSIFAVMIVQMALSGGDREALAHTIGTDDVIEVDNTSLGPEQRFFIRNDSELMPGADIEFMPRQRALGNRMLISVSVGTEDDTESLIDQAGIYELVLPDSGIVKYVAFNYNRKESALIPADLDALQDRLSSDNFNMIEDTERNLASVIGRINEGTPLWKWCVILTLLFLAMEVLVLRFMPGR